MSYPSEQEPFETNQRKTGKRGPTIFDQDPNAMKKEQKGKEPKKRGKPKIIDKRPRASIKKINIISEHVKLPSPTVHLTDEHVDEHKMDSFDHLEM